MTDKIQLSSHKVTIKLWDGSYNTPNSYLHAYCEITQDGEIFSLYENLKTTDGKVIRRSLTKQDKTWILKQFINEDYTGSDYEEYQKSCSFEDGLRHFVSASLL